jgi:hypothetical protein
MSPAFIATLGSIATGIAAAVGFAWPYLSKSAGKPDRKAMLAAFDVLAIGLADDAEAETQLEPIWVKLGRKS